MSNKMTAVVIFAEPSDPDGAAEALREAGYEVRRLPDHFVLDEPGDDFIRVTSEIDGPITDEVLNDFEAHVQWIAGDFGGHVDECGDAEAETIYNFDGPGPNTPIDDAVVDLMASLTQRRRS